MIIKSISLNNIRSYIDQTIDFPEGSVLLSGDIGSGKSTILLALEFALFGLTKKDLPGEALLRKGSKDGHVEVKLDINGKEHTIKRTLKSVAGKVTQTAGYIINGDIKKEGTAVELKSDILALLNYPPEILTKKSLIYRYTVYTPQEEIKSILLDDTEGRLDTLRSVFGIDKYKKIRENSAIYVKTMRDKTKFLSGQVLNLETKQLELDVCRKKGNEMKLKIEYLRPKIEEKKKKFYTQKNVVEVIEKKLIEKLGLKKEIEILASQIESKKQQQLMSGPEIRVLSEDLDSLKIENEKLVTKDLSEMQKVILATKQELETFEKSRVALLQEIKSCEVKKEFLETDIRSILDLHNCPTCRQTVSEEHKEGLTKDNKSKLEHINGLIVSHSNNRSLADTRISLSKNNLDKFNVDLQEMMVMKNKKENMARQIEEKLKRIEKVREQEKKLGEDAEILNGKKIETEKKLDLLDGFRDEQIQNEKILLDTMQKEIHEMELDFARLDKEYESLIQKASELILEIDTMLRINEKIKRIKSLSNWYESFFSPLMLNIEKQVMLQLYNEFNLLFKEWLGILLNDSTLQISLNEDFTPVIVQNGHEISLEHMSGGEKTAIALTYRLALNKVINDLLSHIHTRDVLILDEPTDGFSSEQLDKVRDVLDELNLKQVIIVSHESKIESFVDHCIRISKNEHTSIVNDANNSD